jgi:hypothetical protein
MERFFNTEGPCAGTDHYMLPAESRVDNDVERLIDRKRYFVIHAPRQVGKTTAFSALAERLTAEGRYAALLTSCEVGQSTSEDLEGSIAAVLANLKQNAELSLPEELRPPAADATVTARSRVRDLLMRWAQQCPRPLVLFLDEIDALKGDVLINVLRQLRAGFAHRPQNFPHAVALIGLRDVRDYRLLSRQDPVTGGDRFGTSSPFNIKARSLLLRNFNAEEVTELYGQHTAATGQKWTQAAKERAFELTQGQPWLVNALADQVAGWDVDDRSVLLDVAHIESARETLIARRDTHLDSLVARLQEERVHKVLAPILAGDPLTGVLNDDLQFAKDLGLVTSGPQGLEIANPIYREIVPRVLTEVMEESIVLPRLSYIDDTGRLDFERLLEDFNDFWRVHAESYLGVAPYSEAASQLVFMAYLHKITNGKGHGAVDREYAAGRGRLDLCVRWPRPGGGFDRWAIELKVWRDNTPLDPVAEGKDQLAGYLERLGLDSGTLMVFDCRSDAQPLPGRMSREEVVHQERKIVVRML